MGIGLIHPEYRPHHRRHLGQNPCIHHRPSQCWSHWPNLFRGFQTLVKRVIDPIFISVESYLVDDRSILDARVLVSSYPSGAACVVVRHADREVCGNVAGGLIAKSPSGDTPAPLDAIPTHPLDTAPICVVEHKNPLLALSFFPLSSAYHPRPRT